MPTTTGTIKAIFVNPTYCCLTVDQTVGADKLMVLWSYASAADDTPKNRQTHGAYLAVARDALNNNLNTELSHQENSSIVDSIRVLK